MRAATGALALASTAAALVAVELALRLALPPPRTHAGEALVFDAGLGFRGEPGARLAGRDARGPFQVALDAQGLRQRTREPGAQQAARAIALIGDSFVVAQGVRDADTLSSRLEAELAARALPARVHDLAVVDYGSAQQLLLWRAQARRLGAEISLLALYPANDFANNTLALAGRTTVSPGDYWRPYLVARPDGGFERRHAHPWRAALRRASRLFAVLEQRALAEDAARGSAWLEPWPASDSVEARLRSGRAHREELELHREPAPGSAWAQAWSISERLLVAFRDEVRAQGGRFVVLVIPSLLQVQEEATSLRLDLLARRYAGRGSRELFDWNLPERRLAEFLAREEIEALLLLDAFREAARAGDALYLPDGHLAPRGHALAAARLADALASRAPQRALSPRSEAPTALLPPPDAAAARLDFRAAPHGSYLVRGGWLDYGASGDAAGWLPAARASLVLPARRGDLVLRGHVADAALLPVSVRLRLGDAQVRGEISAPGAFALRLPEPLAHDAPRWVEVRLELVARAAAGGAASLRVTSVGFE